MKKIIITVSILILAAALTTASATALAGKDGQAGKSNTGHLYLYEKDPSTWEIIEGGAWGKMKYNTCGEEFAYIFNGHGLEAGQDYTLIYYPDPWPGTDLICLGDGTANRGGNIHVQGSVDTGDLPSANDANEGAKIWLVPSDDVDCGVKMIAWHPAEYLFENSLIAYSQNCESLPNPTVD